MQELVEARGLLFENHQVETEDGHILSLHRVFKKTPEGSSSVRPAFLMQHGVFASSESYLLNGDKSLAY